MVAADCLVEDTAVGQWVTEREPGEPGQKSERGFRKELRGSCHTWRRGPQGARGVAGREDPTAGETGMKGPGGPRV